MGRPPLLLLVVVMGLGLALGSGLDLHKRVIGGQVCGANERLYHVQLEIFDGNGYSGCGGSLIRRQWILTATHCSDNAVTITAALGVHPDPAQATVVQITEPPVIYRDAKGRRHDIMLLRLTNPAPPRIPTVPLPDCHNPLTMGARVQAAGHAAYTTLANNQRDPNGFSDVLRCAEFGVVDCGPLRHIIRQPQYGPMRVLAYQRWLCAQDTRQPPSVDICGGDSGGGVVDTATNSLYGVLSFTGDPDYACTRAFGFMDVCRYLRWINKMAPPPPAPAPPPKRRRWNCFGC